MRASMAASSGSIQHICGNGLDQCDVGAKFIDVDARFGLVSHRMRRFKKHDEGLLLGAAHPPIVMLM